MFIQCRAPNKGLYFILLWFIVILTKNWWFNCHDSPRVGNCCSSPTEILVNLFSEILLQEAFYFQFKFNCEVNYNLWKTKFIWLDLFSWQNLILWNMYQTFLDSTMIQARNNQSKVILLPFLINIIKSTIVYCGSKDRSPAVKYLWFRQDYAKMMDPTSLICLIFRRKFYQLNIFVYYWHVHLHRYSYSIRGLTKVCENGGF